ncbi:cation diffusion facilitator family transporter [Aromatoleum sp.]|uniref:cation diffusion facilitator family transporter n=1 Tax=Aromatoleum sp. TaxID=2307007 RepID=UPI002FCAEDAF
MTMASPHPHDHGHPGHSHHGHAHATRSHHGHAHAAHTGRALPWALAMTLTFAAVEAVAGWWSGSLALVGDAGHMLTDSLALALATVAAVVSRRPASVRHSYGLRRFETLAGLLNGLFMLVLVILISWHAVERLLDPRPVAGAAVTLVAAIGLAINLLVAWLLSHGEDDLNTRGALLHVMGDMLGSVAALVSGLVITYTGWLPVDPLLSMLICGLILASTLKLLRTAAHTLLEGVPDDLSLPEIGRTMAGVEGVHSIHDLHVWSLDSNHVALSAHVVVRTGRDWPDTLARLQNLLNDRFGIAHVTLQPEPLPGQVVTFAARSPARAADLPGPGQGQGHA